MENRAHDWREARSGGCQEVEPQSSLIAGGSANTTIDLLRSLVVLRQGKAVPILPSIDGCECGQPVENMTTEGSWSSQELTLLTPLPPDECMPPPSAQPHQDDGDRDLDFQDSRKPNFSYALQSLDEFEKENPYTPKGLIPLQGKRSSDCVAHFYQLCQSHGLQPVFEIPEIFKGGFTAKVSFGECIEEVTYACPSKQAAKQAVCKLAIARLPAPEKKAGVKRKASYTDVVAPQRDMSENWIGLILEHAQQKKLAMPEFNEFATQTYPTQFACTLTIADRQSEPFGSETLFPTKQGAKATAAKEAVLWLRENGKMPAVGMKRRRTLDISNLGAGNTGLTQILGGFGVDDKTAIGQRVHEKIIALGLHSPIYHMKPSTASSGQAMPATGFWDIAATFDERDVAAKPKLAGRIGEAKHVYGKQKAKEACSEKVLQLLESL